MMNRKIFKSRALLLPAIALAATLGFTLSAQAVTCTIINWEGGAIGLTDANAGVQDPSNGSVNRRYGGPCGLRVPVEGAEAYVTDISPDGENSYIARFYGFFNNAGSDPILIFAADDDFEDQIQIWYEDGAISLVVFDNTGESENALVLTEAGVGSGWHSIEFVWEESATANIALSVNGADDLTDTVNTSGIEIHNAHLGNINAANTGGTMDFDDFDSRRASRPGRLVPGLTSGTEINVSDLIAVVDEIDEFSFAPGQPDCNEDGQINVSDVICIVDIIDSN